MMVSARFFVMFVFPAVHQSRWVLWWFCSSFCMVCSLVVGFRTSACVMRGCWCALAIWFKVSCVQFGFVASAASMSVSAGVQVW